ncbi:MAG: hypothetical protein QOD59_1274 [Mycobacterium sp.]|nr:hypothetical protein [Mycobacterium sp.]
MQPDIPSIMRGAEQVADRQPQGCLGQVGQGAGHGLQRPEASHIRDRGDQGDSPLRLAKRGSDIRALRGSGNTTKTRQALRQRIAGTCCCKKIKRLGFPHHQFSEVGTVAP